MKQGSFDSESSPSVEAASIAEQAPDQQESDVAVLCVAGKGKSVDDPATGSKVITTLNSLPVDAIVQRASYRDTNNGAPADPAK